ncbi:uncharacterized protein BDZ99DRAFT_468642 [Mytilinidion resinicola]|uniref:Uncharacterized protein n=1 Tax=Mytilinidion resinicola TaxID=574789 RepID=A0A6A6Y394_9PEZI|nr:uncharacterized protein BDZ99DRAFT_468642 [Mytilinidion resinicola]KAF2802993.1 hypothetical protein BDZ99DRAFT_468642 [Mytilinidion resinicola]
MKRSKHGSKQYDGDISDDQHGKESRLKDGRNKKVTATKRKNHDSKEDDGEGAGVQQEKISGPPKKKARK